MIFTSQYEQQRIEKADRLREMGVNPYENRLEPEMSTQAFLEKFAYVNEQEESKEDHSVSTSIAGRVKFLRLMGNAAFAKVEDSGGVMQIYYSKNELGDWFKDLKKLLEVGDIVYARGYPFVTRTGELTMHVTELQFVTKSIVPLPEKYHGLQDVEMRYRQRYLDLIMNREVRAVFKLRSRVIQGIRHFFEEHEFLEVETPMMHPIPGGANARPFVTHHNALGVDRYMRIAPELYLKRLLVGGFEAVFEINRNFRNEGMDYSHNPEFTMLEFYWAYKRYDDLMELTEKLFAYLFEKLGLPSVIPHDGYDVDFSAPFRRIDYVDAIVEIGGLDRETATDPKKALQYLIDHELGHEPTMSIGCLQAELFDNLVEPKLINPTFITGFPVEISPLARRSNDNAQKCDRFELFIGKKEIANGFSELNDPIDQYERFKAQVEAKDAGDEEGMHMDEDYVRALGYGMPSAAGQGLGIDRLVMLLTQQHSIKDVILFPAMRPQSHEIYDENESEETESKEDK